MGGPAAKSAQANVRESAAKSPVVTWRGRSFGMMVFLPFILLAAGCRIETASSMPFDR
jgi:hypothetical protein